MKKILLAFILLVSSLSGVTQAAQSSNEDAASPLPSSALISGCGVSNNLVLPFSGCIAKEDVNMTNLCTLFPTGCDYLPLNEFKTSNIMKNIDPMKSEDRMKELRENENEYTVVARNTFDFGGVATILIFCWFLHFTANRTKNTQDTIELIATNILVDIFYTVCVIIAIYPMFDGYSIFQIVTMYVVMISLVMGNIIYSTYIFHQQSADSINNLTEIDTYIADEQKVKRNENYSIAHNDFKKLVAMNTAMIKAQNKIKVMYPDFKPTVTIGVTQASMMNRNFTVSNNFTLRAEDVVVKFGSIKPNFVNIDSLDPRIKKYAVDITYPNILERTISTITVLDTSEVKKGWSEIERRLLDELGTIDSDTKQQIINVFIQHYFQAVSSSLMAVNKIDNKTFSSSFDLINKQARLVAAEIIARDCIRNQNVGFVNKQNERKGDLKLCGSYDPSGEAYSSLILRDGVNTESLKLNSSANIKSTVELITKAKLEIEKARYEAGMPYQNFDAWAGLRKKGVAYFPEVAKYSSRNAVTQDIANMRHSLKITPNIDAKFDGEGNTEYQLITDKLGDTTAIKTTLDEVFLATEPTVNYAQYAQEDAVEAYLNNKVKNTSDDDSIIKLSVPLTVLRESMAMKADAKLTPEGILSCWSEDQKYCPYIQTDFAAGMSNFSTRIFNEYAQLFAVAVAASFIADGYSSKKDSEFQNEIKKQKAEQKKAANNGGNMSFEEKDKKGLSDKKTKKDNKKRNSGTKEQTFSGISGIMMTLTSTVMFFAGVTKVVTDYIPFTFHTSIQIGYQLMAAFYIIAGPVVMLGLLAKNANGVIYRFIIYGLSILLFTQPVAAFAFVFTQTLLDCVMTVFFIFIMCLDTLITSITGTTNSIIGNMLTSIIIIGSFLTFLGLFVYRYIYGAGYGVAYRKIMELIGVAAIESKSGLAITGRLQAGATVVIETITRSFKEGSYRKRSGRAQSTRKADQRIAEKSKRKQRQESAENVDDLVQQGKPQSKPAESTQPKSRRRIAQEAAEETKKREEAELLDKEVEAESKKFRDEKNGVKPTKPDEEKE